MYSVTCRKSVFVVEQIGEEILGNLHGQRETIQRSRNRVKSSKL